MGDVIHGRLLVRHAGEGRREVRVGHERSVMWGVGPTMLTDRIERPELGSLW